MRLSFNKQAVKRGMSTINLFIALAIPVLMASTTTYAEEGHHANQREGHETGREHREVMRDHHVFAVRDVHRFNHNEFNLWRGGRWNQTCYAGRCGWWWFTGEQWYLYDRPVYPYPLMVSEVTYLEPIAPQPPVMEVPPMEAPVMTAPPAALPAPTWYYCESARSYYPYVPSCPEGWKPVAAQPPQTR